MRCSVLTLPFRSVAETPMGGGSLSGAGTTGAARCHSALHGLCGGPRERQRKRKTERASARSSRTCSSHTCLCGPREEPSLGPAAPAPPRRFEEDWDRPEGREFPRRNPAAPAGAAPGPSSSPQLAAPYHRPEPPETAPPGPPDHLHLTRAAPWPKTEMVQVQPKRTQNF